MMTLSRLTPFRIPGALLLVVAGLFLASLPAVPAVAAQADVPPVLNAPSSVTGQEGMLIQFDVYADDPDGDPIAFLGLCGGSPGICLSCFVPDPDNRHGVFSWTPGYDAAGTYSLCFTVSSTTFTATATTMIAVLDTDRPPAVAAPDFVQIQVFETGTFDVTASDPDGDAIASLTAAPLPFGAEFTVNADNTVGTFTWTPTFADEGVYPITFTASNALSGSATTTVLAGGPDRAPVVTAPATQTVVVGSLLSFDVTAADPDGEAIASFTADLSGLPPGHGATFTSNASNTLGTFTWVPLGGMEGTFSVTFTAANSLSGSAATVISVLFQPQVPVVTAPATASVDEGMPLVFTVSATDPDGDHLLLSALGLPLGASFTDHGDNTGTFAWTPDYTQAGFYTVTFRAVDPFGASAQAVTAISVANVNRAPTADAGGPYIGFAGLPLSFDGTGSSDPDGDPLTFEWSFGDGETGTGTTTSHTYSLMGLYPVTLAVRDPGGLSGSASTTADIRTACEAALFQTGGDRTLRLGSGKRTWCTYVEPMPGCFTIDQVLASSIVLKYPAGTGTGVPAITGKTSIGGDADHDGVGDISVCFSKDDLRSLFAGLPSGENFVTVSVDGDLSGGGRFVATGVIRVSVAGGALAARITPTPVRGWGEISFVTRQAGPARVRLFDLQGRVVRTLLDDAAAPAGSHAVRFDGRGSNGAPLAAGVYFFRIEADGKEETGRMVIAR